MLEWLFLCNLFPSGAAFWMRTEVHLSPLAVSGVDSRGCAD